MARYTIQTEQLFEVTYEVEADTPEEAWQSLIDPGSEAECSSQFPGEITGPFENAVITEAP